MCAQCPCTGDSNGDGKVTIEEIVDAVNNALDGCPELLWYRGCGPPIHGAQTCPPSVDFCTTQQIGARCDEPGATCCQPGSKCGGSCNSPLVCTTKPPVHCPISRRRYKSDIEYLAPSDIERLRNQLLAIKLTRFRYKGEAGSAPPHLGFIIDDVEPSPSVAEDGKTVDLYGYLSMAVAAIQAQAKSIHELREEVKGLRDKVNKSEVARHAK